MKSGFYVFMPEIGGEKGCGAIAPKDEDANRHKRCAENMHHFSPRDARFGTPGSDIKLPISGGSVTKFPATDAWLGALIGDGTSWASLLGMYGASSHSPDKLKAAIVAASVQENEYHKAC